MKVQVPEELRGTKFSKVLSIELNSFDIERLLPGLFFLVIADGHGTVTKTRNDETVDKHVDLLAGHKDLAGFEGSEGKLLLERLLRTTLITTVRTSANRSKERVTSIKSYSLLSLKTAENHVLRLADIFTYQALKSVLQNDNDLKALIKHIFGKGVIVTGRPDLGGKYDGHTNLDTLTRLSIAFLEGFPIASSKVKRDKDNALGACPPLVRAFGADIHSYLIAYHDKMPTQAFMYYLQGLLRFELYMYTLKLVHAVNALVAHPEHLPTAMQETFALSQPQIYLDFTGKMDGESMYMAKAGVSRDIEAYQRFFTSNLLLRQLDSYISKLRRPGGRWHTLIENALNGSETGPLYLQKLLQLQDHPRLGMQIEALAMHEVDAIRDFNRQTKDGQEEDLSWLDAVANTGETELERVVALLGEAQRSDTLQHYLRWIWNVGGSEHPFSLIEGRRNARSSWKYWKYAPTNELLSVLVQLAATRIGLAEGQSERGKEVRGTLRLQDFLDYLESRFGILIDHPPAQFQGAEYVAAARENLRAMLRRLRQMSIFRDLSDDFTAQRLHPPYVGEQLERVEG
jgi:hypothetical protein